MRLMGGRVWNHPHNQCEFPLRQVFHQTLAVVATGKERILTHTDYVTHFDSHCMIMLPTYGSDWKRVVWENLLGAVQHQKQHYDRKTTGGR